MGGIGTFLSSVDFFSFFFLLFSTFFSLPMAEKDSNGNEKKKKNSNGDDFEDDDAFGPNLFGLPLDVDSLNDEEEDGEAKSKQMPGGILKATESSFNERQGISTGAEKPEGNDATRNRAQFLETPSSHISIRLSD